MTVIIEKAGRRITAIRDRDIDAAIIGDIRPCAIYDRASGWVLPGSRRAREAILACLIAEKA